MGAAAGVLVGMCSVALLTHEAYALLRQRYRTGGSGGTATEAAAAEEATPRLQLALPGVTLPASHALPLWLALALSLVVHEVHGLGRRSGLMSMGGSSLIASACLPAGPSARPPAQPAQPSTLNNACRLGMHSLQRQRALKSPAQG